MSVKTMGKEGLGTRDRILDTATDLIAEKGFEGVRVDEIAKAAGVNKAAIYYHIGDKKALYETVLVNVFTGIADKVEKNADSGAEPVEKIKSHIAAIASGASSSKKFAPIWLREVADGGKNMPEEVIKQLIRILDSLSKILEEGKKKALFTNANLFVVHMMIVGGIVLSMASEPIRRKIAHRSGGASSPLLIPMERTVSELTEMIIKSICA